MKTFPITFNSSISSGIVFYDSFETDLSEWYTWGEPGWSVTRTTEESTEGSYSMNLINATYGNYAAAYHSGLTISQNFEWSYDFRYKSGYSNFAAYSYMINSNGTTFASLLWFDNVIRYYNGSTYITFYTGWSFNTWYNIKYVIDFSTETYDIYINDSIEQTGAIFRASASDLDKIQLLVGAGSSNSGNLFVDNLSVTI